MALLGLFVFLLGPQWYVNTGGHRNILMLTVILGRKKFVIKIKQALICNQSIP